MSEIDGHALLSLPRINYLHPQDVNYAGEPSRIYAVEVVHSQLVGALMHRLELHDSNLYAKQVNDLGRLHSCNGFINVQSYPGEKTFENKMERVNNWYKSLYALLVKITDEANPYPSLVPMSKGLDYQSHSSLDEISLTGNGGKSVVRSPSLSGVGTSASHEAADSDSDANDDEAGRRQSKKRKSVPVDLHSSDDDRRGFSTRELRVAIASGEVKVRRRGATTVNAEFKIHPTSADVINNSTSTIKILEEYCLLRYHRADICDDAVRHGVKRCGHSGHAWKIVPSYF